MTALAGKHASALLIEEGSGKLFAGAHGEEGVWVSDDGTGASWRAAAKNIGNRNIYSLASRRDGNRAVLIRRRRARLDLSQRRSRRDLARAAGAAAACRERINGISRRRRISRM